MEKIIWASKVPQTKILRLYQNDAAGMVDDELVVDVGWRLFQRCRSIFLATGRGLASPRCGTEFYLPETEPWRILPGQHACP
jgi:hypothetical protein